MSSVAVQGPGGQSVSTGYGTTNSYLGAPLIWPRSVTYTAPEGVDNYTLVATDLVGNPGNGGVPATWQVKIDRTNPVINFDDSSDSFNSNLLYEKNSSGSYDLGATDYDLAIDATDPSPNGGTTSGVGSVSVAVDNPSNVEWSGTSNCDGCGIQHDYNFDTAAPGHGDGTHTIYVTATDRAGNATTTTLTVNVDRESGDHEYDNTVATPDPQQQDGSTQTDPATCLAPVDLANIDPSLSDAEIYCGELTDANPTVSQGRAESTGDTTLADYATGAPDVDNATAATLAKGGSGWGLSDQNLETPAVEQDPNFQSLAVPHVRIVVPYDLYATQPDATHQSTYTTKRNDVTSAIKQLLTARDK